VSADTLTPIVKWLDEGSLNTIYSSQYWNDLAEEKTKQWWIADGTDTAFARLRDYLDASGMMESYAMAERYLAQLPQKGLVIADIASGIGWSSSLLSKLPNVAQVHAVELSQHRLELLFPQAVRMFNGAPDKLHRNLGSFYQMGFADQSMDVVFISAAFHHASNALKLLTEMDRILKPGGKLILVGENFVGSVAIARRIVKTLLKERRLCTNFYELFPPDDVAGDHYYRVSDYHMFLQMLGYRLLEVGVQKNTMAAFIAEKTAN
jgi:SAM-dependent methyltransferase